jgi:ATP-dependent DNA ligase
MSGGPRIGMRFHEVDEANIDDLITDPDVVFEQKMDGTRVLVVVTRDGVEFRQSGGQPLAHAAAVLHVASVTAAFKPVHEDMVRTGGEAVFDGELLIRTGILYLFDLPFLSYGRTPVVTTEKPFIRRRSHLENFEEFFDGSCVQIVRQARGVMAKRNLFEAVRASNAEGIIAKSKHAPYEPGKRVKHTVKVKLVKTADVIVTAVDRPDPKHGSFTFGVVASIENTQAGTDFLPIGDVWVDVLGKCSAIGKPEAKVGDVIEVAYLYREPSSGGLVQPRMMRIREDKAPAECTIEQFPDYTREPVAWTHF